MLEVSFNVIIVMHVISFISKKQQDLHFPVGHELGIEIHSAIVHMVITIHCLVLSVSRF